MIKLYRCILTTLRKGNKMNFNITVPPATQGGWISLGLLAFVALSLLIGFFYGLKRGLAKTFIRLITVIAAAVVSYYVAINISAQLDLFFAGKTLEEVITSVYAEYETAVKPETREIIAAFDAETAQLIISLVAALVISPLIFITLFYIAKAVLWIVYWLIGAILRQSSKHKSALSTIVGGLIGIVQGAIIAFCVLLPVTGFLSLAGDVKAEVLAREDLSVESREKVESLYANWLDEPISSPLVSFIGDVGGEVVFAELTSATVEEEQYDMREKASLIVNVCVDTMELKGMNWQSPTPEQQAAIEKIVDRMGNDEYTARILAGVLRGSSTALTDNIQIFGLEPPYDDLFIEAFSIFIDSNAVNVGGDLDTMLEVYFIMANNDILVLIGENDHEGLKNKLIEKNENEELFIDTIIDTLQSNQRTSALVSLFTKLSVSIMCDNLGLDENTVEVYENVKSDLTDVLNLSKEDYENEEEYKAAVSAGVSSALEENGILLEDEIVDGMSDYIAENYSGNEDITDEDINDAILSYYSSYVDYINGGGTLPDDIPDDLIPEA